MPAGTQLASRLPHRALPAGLSTLQELSLASCEQLTAVGLRSLGGLTGMRRLSLQTCNQIRWAQYEAFCPAGGQCRP